MLGVWVAWASTLVRVHESETCRGKSACPGDTTELALGKLEGGTNVNILNSSLEQIVGLVLACGLGSTLSGCLPEVGDLCSVLF